MISRRDLLRSAAALVPAGRLLGWQESAPQSPPSDAKYSTDVNVVNVLVTVRDKEGKIVSTLTKDDFSIEEDGRPQVIRYFAQQFDSPLTLGLLVDTSGSERRNIDSERRASYKFFDEVMREDKDKAFLIHFDHEVELLQDLTASRTQLDKALDELSGDNSQSQRNFPQGSGGGGQGGRGRGGGTTLYDAVLLASEELMSKQQGRKAVILFSDGEDTGSKVSLPSAIEAAQRADTLVYSIRFYDSSMNGSPGFGRMGRGRRGGGFPQQYPNSNREDGKKVLQRISSETGGEYFEVSGRMTLDKIYSQIQDELRNQYSLGYTSDQTGAGYRMIKVKAQGKGLIVQAREGYYAR